MSNSTSQITDGGGKSVRCSTNGRPASRACSSVKAQHLIPQLAAAGRRFDIVYADPPYHARYCGAPLLLGLIEALGKSPLFNDEGLLFVQHQIDLDVPEQSGHLALTQRRPYGNTTLSIYRT